MQIATPRLSLRELIVDDAENFYLLNLDPEVLQFTGDVVFETINAARAFLASYDYYKKYGFGRWAVINKADGAFLGWCGLKYSEDTDEYDIGFRFFKKYWNNGYATEAAKACLEIGFNTFKMPKIVGRAMTANAASVWVFEKIGLSYERSFDFDGEDGVVYSIKNAGNN